MIGDKGIFCDQVNSVSLYKGLKQAIDRLEKN